MNDFEVIPFENRIILAGRQDVDRANFRPCLFNFTTDLQ
jgi:hypothetical protein